MKYDNDHKARGDLARDPPLPAFHLEVYFARWEFAAEHHLSASDAQTMKVSELLEYADQQDLNAWEHLALGYTQTRGDPALREAIAATYDAISADDIICFAGAEEGIWCAMHALLREGDHAVVVVPTYQSAETLPLLLCEATGVSLHAPDWRLDLEELRAAIRPNTRLVSINFPNNPTGHVIDRAQFGELVALCASRGIYLLSDEVYRGIERDAATTLPQAADVYNQGLSLNVMSKAYGLPGLRIGWIATRDRDLLERMERIKHYLSICNSGPSEVLARIALKSRRAIRERNRQLCVSNLALLDQFFSEYPNLFEWRAPAGGCVAFPRYLGPEGVEALCKTAVEDAGVLLLPASIYQSTLAPVPKDRFRIGYGRDKLEPGLQAWSAVLER